ncbi:MFS transporter [Streptomyces sp. 900116325]
MDHVLDDEAQGRPPGAPSGGDDSSAVRRWWILAVLLAGQFMANIDTAIVNVASPTVQDDLGASGGQVALVVSGYVVAYAVLLVNGARLGATLGHRRIFLQGTILFSAASLACGVAPGPVPLIIARLLQGAGAALMVPQVLSGIQLHFARAEQSRALGYYAIALSGGAVAGQVLGGLLVAADVLGMGWRPIFLINVPAGLALIFAAWRWMPADRPGAASPTDVRGVALLTSSVGLLIVPLVLGPENHWPVWTWLCLLASVPLGVYFAHAQRELAARGGRPLIAPAAVRPPSVRWALVAHGLTTMTYFALLFVLALYLQHGLGRSPGYVGLAMVSWVAAFGVAGALLSRLPTRYTRHAAATGCFLLTACYAAVSVYLLAGHRTGPGLLTLLGVGGLGLGISSNALIDCMTSVTDARYATDLSGVISTNAQLSGALGVAALGAGYLALSRSAGSSAPAHALTATLTVCAGLALCGTIAAYWAVRRGTG